MKKSNIIGFIVIVLIIGAIVGFAIYDKKDNNAENQNMEYIGPENTEESTNGTIENEVDLNSITSNSVNSGIMSNSVINGAIDQNAVNYKGNWYISQEAYWNAEKIDELMDKREDNLISNEEYEAQLKSDINTNVVELDVENYLQNRITFSFELTSPAPTRREAKLDDITVELNNNVGTFTYTDNWGTSGNGTITLKENSIELKLETTKANQGALWGVEGVYTFSYQTAD